MEDIRCITTSGAETMLTGEAIGTFKASLRGEFLTPDSTGYNEARTIWNAMIDKRPAIIVRCFGTADVMRAVDFAGKHQLLVSVRGGGHNIAGNALCDGGLMIDLSPMKSVRVNPQSQRALVEPGATIGDFDHEAQAFGLATPLGINSTTGVAGLTLGGGFGWLSRKYGMSVDNLIAAEVVTADARLVKANDKENADLFWGIRGGGGNFGIVTSFEFQLHPVGPEVFSGLIVYPLEQGRSILSKYREFVETIPDEFNAWAVLRQAPPLPFLPSEVHGKGIVVFGIFHAGDVAEGKELVEPLRGMGEPHWEHLGPQPYVAWQKAFDPLLAFGARNYWKSHNLSQLSDGVIDAAIKYGGKFPSPHCEILIGLLGGHVCRVPPDSTAYSQRDAKFVMNVHGRWETAAEDQKCLSWAHELFDAAAPYATGGVYVNFMTQDETGRVPAAYKQEVMDRLVGLKNKWDPKNMFRMNQNIKPSV